MKDRTTAEGNETLEPGTGAFSPFHEVAYPSSAPCNAEMMEGCPYTDFIRRSAAVYRIRLTNLYPKPPDLT